MHEHLKLGHAVETTAQLIELLEADVQDWTRTMRISSSGHNKPPRVVFAFTRQAQQYAGMGARLFHRSEPFRQMVEHLHSLSLWHGFPAFIQLLLDPSEDIATHDPVQAQLALVVLEMALADPWRSWGVEPDVVVGYSLGEYPALCTAGVLSANDVLFLVGHRAQLMEKTCTPNAYAMLAAPLSASEVAAELMSKLYDSLEI